MAKLQHVVAVLVFLLLLFAVGAMMYLVACSVQQVDSPAVTPSVVARATTAYTVTPSRPASPLDAPNAQRTLPPTWTPTQTPTVTPTRTPKPPTPTVTPTPLPPRRPTAVAITLTPTVNASSTYTIPMAVPRYPIPVEAITVVLLGSDQRPDWSHWNTDVIQYVVIYADIPSVSILSIPRDLYVYVPNFGMHRINTADMYGEIYHVDGGGIGLLNQTLLYNLGITADYYVKVNFDGLTGMVDAIGGIDMPVHCRLEDYWPYPNEQGEYSMIALEPGIHHLDGEMALWYSRSRKTTSVFSRERRQQQVLEAMWRRARQANLLQAAAELYPQFNSLFETDLGVGNILSLAVTGVQLDAANIRRYNIGAKQVDFYITEQGGNVFLPKWEEIEPVIAAAIAKPASNRATQNPIQVEVWNATGYPDWDQLAADTLYQYGYVPIINSPDGNAYPQTQIVYFSTTTKGTGIDHVQSLFNVRSENLIYQENPGAGVKLRLILGQDYNPCP